MDNTNIEPRQENVDLMVEDVIHTFNNDALFCMCHVAAIKEELLTFPNSSSKTRYEFWDKVYQALSEKLFLK